MKAGGSNRKTPLIPSTENAHGAGGVRRSLKLSAGSGFGCRRRVGRDRRVSVSYGRIQGGCAKL